MPRKKAEPTYQSTMKLSELDLYVPRRKGIPARKIIKIMGSMYVIYQTKPGERKTVTRKAFDNWVRYSRAQREVFYL